MFIVARFLVCYPFDVNRTHSSGEEVILDKEWKVVKHQEKERVASKCHVARRAATQ